MSLNTASGLLLALKWVWAESPDTKLICGMQITPGYEACAFVLLRVRAESPDPLTNDARAIRNESSREMRGILPLLTAES